MSVAILTPFTGASGRPVGQQWRKKLLPVGEINYKGRVLKFTRDYLGGLVSAFNQRAYDQVPFQLAGDDNKHTNDVERTGGQITGMALEDDGLWVTVQPSARGAAVLKDNPGLGVSARIVEEYARSDGQFFPRAIQHVLGTLDPRIPGMGGWEAVAAANDAEVTFDLSGEQFTGEEPGGMPELTEDQQTRLAALLNIDPAKLAALADRVDPEAVAQLDGGEPEPDPELDALAAEIENMTPEQLAELEAELEAEEAAEAEPVTAGALSSDDQVALELAQAGVDENTRQLGIITAQLDHERWTNERGRLVAAGTPPFIADLAQPLLEGGGHVVDLANGKSVDAGQIMRKVLTEYAKLGEQLGIGVELGSPMDEPTDQTAETERDEIVKRAKAQLFGMR